tara:strand:+ start:71 stop:388 length:318 start_codon:yes stop_codon:yes gene_type:complete
MENQTVINICGVYPENFVKQDITSNPDFVFKNDPSYSVIQLYDIDENTVFVNSFIECEHYVTGGWEYNPVQNLETSMQFLIIGAIFLSVIIKFIYSRTDISLFGN